MKKHKATSFSFFITLPCSIIVVAVLVSLYGISHFFQVPIVRILLIPLISIILVFIVRFQSKTYSSSSLPPGPTQWPIIGNLPSLLRNKPRFRWVMGLMEEYKTDIAYLRIYKTHIILVACPKIAIAFLKKQDAMFVSRPITMASEYASSGFLTVATTPWGKQWKKMKKVLASEVLNKTRFLWLLHKRIEEADNLIYYIYNQCMGFCHNKITHGTVINLRVATRLYSGNVIRKLVFNKRYFGEGRNDGGLSVREEEHDEALFTILGLLYSFCISDYIPSLRCFDFDGHEKIIKEATQIIRKNYEPIINGRLQEWRYGKDGYVRKKEPEDLLDVLISLKDENGIPLLSSEEIKAQIVELCFATIDNPSNAVEWAMAEMIKQPAILQKAVDEIDKVVGQERLIQEFDFPKLNYVKACAREAFRLHPIAPFNLPHVSMEDTIVAGYFIPKGSHVLLSRFGLGRNPKVWEDPLKFDPERHMSSADQVIELTEPDLRFISFSTGRRGCVGVSLGSAMTIMLLARLLQAFDWKVPPGEMKIDLTESIENLFLAKSLHAYAMPRLPPHMYQILKNNP